MLLAIFSTLALVSAPIVGIIYWYREKDLGLATFRAFGTFVLVFIFAVFIELVVSMWREVGF